MKRRSSRIIDVISVCALFLLLSSFFWIWLFSFAADTDAAHKVTVYADVPAMDETAFSLKLEENMPQGIKMVRAHSFMYAMFSTSELEHADIYMIPASKISDYRDSLLATEGEDALKYYSGTVGIKVYDAQLDSGCAKEYITYLDEDYYLFFGSGSVHIGDGAAAQIADAILSLKD